MESRKQPAHSFYLSETLSQKNSFSPFRLVIDKTRTHVGGRTIITQHGRIFYALRKDGPSRGHTPVYHAVSPHCRVALCCAEPGVQSGWAEPPASRVTCAACKRRLERLERSALAIRKKAG
jgi:hypothetical protein